VYKLKKNRTMSYKNLKKQIKKGDRLMTKGDIKSAIKTYKEALIINRNSKISCNKLADAYMKIKKHKKAIKALKRSLEIDSNDDNTHANIAFAFEKMKDYHNAKISYKTALKIRPDMKSYKKSLNRVKTLNKDIQREERIKLEKNKLKKLKQMVAVSDKINLDILMRVLNMDRDSFEDKIFRWAKKYDFKIEKDIIVINHKTVDDFINDITKKISNEKSFCQFCGKLLTDKEIVEKQPLIIWKCSECNTENKG